MAKRTKLFYIGERVNPQFKKSYYVAYGQLSKTAAREKENCVYGSMYMTAYETESEYNEVIENLKTEGFRVNI